MTHYSNPKDKRLLAELKDVSGKHGQCQPVKVWSPDGKPYWVATAATHEEIAGSLVVDGMSETEYWPTVIAGYRATIRHHNARVQREMKAEYRRGWIARMMEHIAQAERA